MERKMYSAPITFSPPRVSRPYIIYSPKPIFQWPHYRCNLGPLLLRIYKIQNYCLNPEMVRIQNGIIRGDIRRCWRRRDRHWTSYRRRNRSQKWSTALLARLLLSRRNRTSPRWAIWSPSSSRHLTSWSRAR